MKWINKLERKYHGWGIHNLISYIVLIKGAAYILNYMDPTGRFLYNIMLIPERVLQGEVWRLITYIAMPPQTSPIFVMFAFMLMYIYGQGLEREWGTFRFNMFYLIGYLGTLISAFIGGGAATTLYLDMSIFWAFAVIYPDFTLRLFFIFPVKVKYLAGISGIFALMGFISSTMSIKLAILVSMLNLILFFGDDMLNYTKNRHRARKNRTRFKTNTKAYQKARVIHKCHVCGKTEKDDPQMEFRYCSTCDGDYEYCMDHLRNHTHVKVQ